MSDHDDLKKSIYDPRYKQLIRFLAEARRQSGISQAKIADTLSLSQSDISKIETCERRIDFIEVIDWTTALGLAPEEYLPRLLKEINGTN